MQTLFRSLVALVLAVTVSGCGVAGWGGPKPNPRYCRKSADCTAPYVWCDTATDQCELAQPTDGGTPTSPTPDLTTPTPPDMIGTPSCSFERQDVCQQGVHCLPRPGQGEDNTTECRLETAMVKATSTAGANNVSIECSDGAGTLNVIKPKVGEWAICPAPTNKAAKALGNDRLYVAVAGSGQIKSYPAGTSVPLL